MEHNDNSGKIKLNQKRKAIFSVANEVKKAEHHDETLNDTFTETPVVASNFHEIRQSECIAFINEKKLDTTLIGQEPWPDDVKLYQPYETEQILLPDMANCLSVQAFLKMCGLNFSVEYKGNAEDMSPSGRVPFIKCGACLVSDLEPITSFVGNKGFSLTSNLDPSQKSDMRAYMSLVNTVLGNAENYITWVDNDTYSNVTKPRYGSVHPFPLNHIITYLKRQNVIKRLSALGWYQKSLDKVYEEVDRGCSALSERLEKQHFFFGDQATELDALLFGHMYSILTTPGFSSGVKLAEKLRRHRGLMKLCRSVMHLLELSDNIDLPKYHKNYLSKHNINMRALEDDSDGNESEEFVYDTDEEDECSEELRKETQKQQDYSCIVNDPNPIYDSIFGISRIELDIEPFGE